MIKTWWILRKCMRVDDFMFVNWNWNYITIFFIANLLSCCCILFSLFLYMGANETAGQRVDEIYILFLLLYLVYVNIIFPMKRYVFWITTWYKYMLKIHTYYIIIYGKNRDLTRLMWKSLISWWVRVLVRWYLEILGCWSLSFWSCLMDLAPLLAFFCYS